MNHTDLEYLKRIQATYDMGNIPSNHEVAFVMSKVVDLLIRFETKKNDSGTGTRNDYNTKAKNSPKVAPGNEGTAGQIA